MEELAGVLELPQREGTEPEEVLAAMRDLLAARILRVVRRAVAAGRALSAWTGWSPIPTFAKFSSTNFPMPARSGSFGCLFSIGPLWQAKQFAPTVGGFREEQLGATQLRCTVSALVVPREELVVRECCASRRSGETSTSPAPR